MKRQDLIENLVTSMRLREMVTLTLRPVRGNSRVTETGRILAVAEHYTSRAALQVVLHRDNRIALVIGLSMILDFQVGLVPARKGR